MNFVSTSNSTLDLLVFIISSRLGLISYISCVSSLDGSKNSKSAHHITTRFGSCLNDDGLQLKSSIEHLASVTDELRLRRSLTTRSCLKRAGEVGFEQRMTGSTTRR